MIEKKIIIERVNGVGLKITPQRIAVLEALMVLDHPTAEEVYRKVSENLPGLSFTTVYNILDVFVKKGLIYRVKTESDIMRYDAIIEKHHHLYCNSCDKIRDYYDTELDQLINNYFSKKQIQGFKVIDVKLQILGEFDAENITTKRV